MNLNTANLMVGKAASTDPMRANLNSIHVTDRYTEATNGHILARVSLPNQFPIDDLPVMIKTEDAEYIEPFIIPAIPAMKIKMFRAKRGPSCLNDSLYVDVVKSNENGTAKFIATDLETTLTPELTKIQADYPEVDRVIPTFSGEEHELYHTRLNISYLETLLVIAKSTGAEAITLDAVKGSGRPVLLTAEHEGQNFTGVIMPLRD